MSSSIRRAAAWTPWLGLLPPLVALVAWRALAHGYFYSDDFQTLYDFANGTWVRAVFAPAFGHVNMTRNAVAGLLYTLVGPRAEVFYGAALLAHVLNAFLLYRVAARLSGDAAIAAAVAIAWSLSPPHHGTLDWYAAHGHAWITALALLMLDRLVTFEQRDQQLGAGEAVLWGAALIIMTTSYGVGMGVAFSFPVVALVIAGRRLRPAAVAVLFAALLLFVAIYVSLKAYYPPPVAKFGHLASPTLAQMLAHPIALLHLNVLLPVVGISALLFGPLFDGATPPGWAHGLACVVFAGLLLAGFRYSGRSRWLLGLLLLGLGTYPLIALGRIVLAPDDPAGLALTPRYHYAPQAAFALALAVSLASLRRIAPRLVAGGAAAWVAVLLVALVARPLPMELHEPDRRASERAVQQILAAVRRTPPGETVYIPNATFPPMLFLANFQGDWKFPGLAGVYVVFFPDDEVEGRRVRFVATDPAQLEATATGGRIATLLIPAPANPPS